MKFFQLDPRPQGAEQNEKIFAEDKVILGIEVTIPNLWSRCVVNLDHHGVSDTAETPSACEQALTWWHPEADFRKGVVMVTVRPDADSVTAMAVIANRTDGRPVDEELVHAVGRFDRYGPSSGKPDARVSAIARKAFDFKLQLEQRVEWVADLLAGIDKSDEVTALVAAHDSELAAARQASELTFRTDNRIACVVSTHRFAFIEFMI